MRVRLFLDSYCAKQQQQLQQQLVAGYDDDDDVAVAVVVVIGASTFVQTSVLDTTTNTVSTRSSQLQL